MSRKQPSTALALTALASLACACSKPSPQAAAPSFEWTNIVHEASAFNDTPATGTLLYFINGSWCGQYPDRLTLGLRTGDYEATVFFR